jgi:resuscitation-promoting factor RpfB
MSHDRSIRCGFRLFLACGLVLLTACGAADSSVTLRQSSAEQTPTAGMTTLPTAEPAPAQTVPETTMAATATTATATTATATTAVTYQAVTRTKRLAFTTKKIKDSSLAEGVTKVTTRGVAGLEKFTYRVTLRGGVEVQRVLVGRSVIKKPRTQVIAVGTKQESNCDPNYSGACVPIASDVDCAGGSGNGPAYVTGPVTVTGTDIYDLDRDGDGIGCE